MSARPASRKQFRVRQALFSDFNPLLEFYRFHRSDVLPLEPAKVVGDTIAQGRILIVEPLSAPIIVASAAIFQATPQNAPTYVGELAGTRVTKVVGGASPITVQTMLLGLRLLGHAASELQSIRPMATNSLIAIVEKANTPSIENIEAIGMKPLHERPHWIKYNELGWHGTIVTDEWKYYYADNDTIRQALIILEKLGLFGKQIDLRRTSKISGEDEQLEFRLELNDLVHARDDLVRIIEKKSIVDLVPPPAEIRF